MITYNVKLTVDSLSLISRDKRRLALRVAERFMLRSYTSRVGGSKTPASSPDIGQRLRSFGSGDWPHVIWTRGAVRK